MDHYDPTTGGGDAPGLNAVIRAVVKCACNSGIGCLGLEDSFDGLIEFDRSRMLAPRDVTGILRLGGTILGTINTRQPVRLDPIETSDGTRDYYGERVHRHVPQDGLDALVVIGGDGTLAIGHEFCKRGIPLVGVPKTIDNDIVGTTNCFGFDTAVAFATDAIDRLHTTAEAHHRIMVVEVMGRYAGWIALYAGVAGGADAILIPEIPFDIEHRRGTSARSRQVGRALQHRRRRRRRVSEGRHASLLQEAANEKHVERLGGIGAQLCAAIADLTRQGDAQRRARPSAARRRAHQLRPRARDALRRQGRRADHAAATSARWWRWHPPDIIARPLEDIVGKTKTVPMDIDLLLTARALGITFGD